MPPRNIIKLYGCYVKGRTVFEVRIFIFDVRIFEDLSLYRTNLQIFYFINTGPKRRDFVLEGRRSKIKNDRNIIYYREFL